MPSLSSHQSNSFTKLLLLGDAKSGKTGSLVSLVKAGYKLRILDLDNLLDILKYKVLEECPDNLANVEFRSVRDKYKPGPGGTQIDGKPKAWTESLKLLSNWKYTDETSGEEIDYGNPAEWGSDTILVIDSLSRWCDSAYDFHEAIIPRGKSGDYDGRAVYGNAQDDVEKQLAMLMSNTIRTNIIVIAHGTYMDLPDGTKKIFPQGVGQKLSLKIPQYFPNYIRYKNKAGKRTIQVESDAMIDLANTRPNTLNKELPIETGLAEFFSALRDAPVKNDKPKSVTLIRKA
jgi:hypothetical protein